MPAPLDRATCSSRSALGHSVRSSTLLMTALSLEASVELLANLIRFPATTDVSRPTPVAALAGSLNRRRRRGPGRHLTLPLKREKNFSGKWQVKFGHFVNFSYVIFSGKNAVVCKVDLASKPMALCEPGG